MLVGECFAGEDAEVLVEAIKVDYSGEDVDTIQDLVVYVKHYKETEVVATGATAEWNSNMGQYLITIPSAFVPASGTFDICVRGSDISDVLIRLQVNTADAALTALQNDITAIKGPTWSDETLVTIQAAAEAGGTSTGGSESVITSYTLDASEKTIDTTDTTLTIEQIKYILNLTTGNEIYDSSNPRKRRLQMTAPADQVGIDISITSGVISYIESSAMTDDDKIKVVVESAHV